MHFERLASTVVSHSVRSSRVSFLCRAIRWGSTSFTSDDARHARRTRAQYNLYSVKGHIRKCIHAFNVAALTGDAATVRSIYPVYAAWRRDPRLQDSIWSIVTDPRPVFAAMDILSASNMPEDRSMLDTILSDIDELWAPGFRAAMAVPAGSFVLVRNLCRYSRQDLAILVLESYAMEVGPNALTTKERALWELILESYIAIGARDRISSLVQRMKRSGVVPCRSFFNHLLHYLSTIDPLPNTEISSWVADMKQMHIPWDYTTYGILLTCYIKLGMKDAAEEAVQYLLKHYTDLSGRSRNALAQYAAYTGDVEQGWQEVEVMVELGQQVQPRTVATLTEAEGEGMDDDKPETWWRTVYGILLQADSDKGRALERALDIYEAAKTRLIPPHAKMATPLIEALCPVGAASKAGLDRAMSIYEDICMAYPPTESDPNPFGGPTDRIFVFLLSALVANREFGRANIMFLNIHHRGLHIRTSFLNLCLDAIVRTARDHEEAFQCYVHAAVVSNNINNSDFFPAFIKASYPTSLYPPASRALELFGYWQGPMDGPKEGLKLMKPVVVLLNRYNQVMSTFIEQGGRDLPSALAGVLKHVREVHRWVQNQDGSWEPSVRVFNALMNAYNLAGEFEECYKVWEELRTEKNGVRMTAGSISIILDSVGHARNRRLLQDIWRDVQANNAQMAGPDSWQAYVENLSRIEYDGFTCARDLVSFTMGTAGDAQKNIPPADIEIVRTLLSSAIQYGRLDETKEMVQKHLPQIYAELSDSRSLRS